MCAHTQALRRAQGPAWGGSHARQPDVVVTGLPGQSCRLTLHWLGTGDVAELHKQQFLMHRWNERKIKKFCIHLNLSQKKKVLVILKLFLLRDKCISLIQNAVIYSFRYTKCKSIEGVKWIQSLQSNQKTPCLSIPLAKRGCLPERETASQMQKTLRTQATT